MSTCVVGATRATTAGRVAVVYVAKEVGTNAGEIRDHDPWLCLHLLCEGDSRRASGQVSTCHVNIDRFFRSQMGAIDLATGEET